MHSIVDGGHRYERFNETPQPPGLSLWRAICRAIEGVRGRTARVAVHAHAALKRLVSGIPNFSSLCDAPHRFYDVGRHESVDAFP